MSWVQGTGATTQVVARQLYQPPASFGPLKRFQYARGRRPMLAWSHAHDLWGPLRYVVTVDRLLVGQSAATSLRSPIPLSDGPHTWQVAVSNSAGLLRTARPATVWVDTTAPAVNFSLTGARRAGSVLHLDVTYPDAPPGEPRTGASGTAEVIVNWGDRRAFRIRHSKFYAYRRAGTYRLTITVKDRAGNTSTLVRRLRIAPAGKPSRRGR